MPTEEELRSRYNPELLKRSLEGREERQQEFDQFVTRLKEYSKSDKPSLSIASSPDDCPSLSTKAETNALNQFGQS